MIEKCCRNCENAVELCADKDIVLCNLHTVRRKSGITVLPFKYNEDVCSKWTGDAKKAKQAIREKQEEGG